MPPFEHPGDAQVLVDDRPVDAHRHELIIGALRCRRALQARMSFERRCDLAAIHERNDKFARRELHRARFQVANLKFQSAHSPSIELIRGCTTHVKTL